MSTVGLETMIGRVWICVRPSGAGLVASVGAAVRAGPLENPAAGLLDSPSAVGLEAVMSSTKGAEVGGDRRAGLRSLLGCGVVVERDGVVDV